MEGLADREKFGEDEAATVRDMVVVLLRLPLTPVMVTIAVPLLALFDAIRVSVLVRLVELGLKPAVTPDGKPLALRETVPLNPPLGVTVMVLVPPAP